jgi:hypothetical protein
MINDNVPKTPATLPRREEEAALGMDGREDEI